MSLWHYLIALVVLVFFAWQVAVWLDEARDKNTKYRDATACAEHSGKPLLIAGGPWGIKPYRYWLKKPAHGNGDVCLDIDRRALRDHPCGVVADITRIPFAGKSFGAAFASHIMEHLNTTEDARKALDELSRVAERVFIVAPSRQSVTAWVKSEHHLWVWQKDNVIYLEQRGSPGQKEIEEYILPGLTAT
ncbi:MAG: methyltransferase domain-containing protein [Chloroflexota bacterium]